MEYEENTGIQMINRYADAIVYDDYLFIGSYKNGSATNTKDYYVKITPSNITIEYTKDID